MYEYVYVFVYSFVIGGCMHALLCVCFCVCLSVAVCASVSVCSFTRLYSMGSGVELLRQGLKGRMRVSSG